MFRSTKAPEEGGVRQHDHPITGLERAKLEHHDPVAPAPAPAPAPKAAAPAPVQNLRPPAPVIQVQDRRPAAPVAHNPRPAAPNTNAQLIAGAGVTLKGDMQCDMLRVEGTIEGNVKARKLEIAAGGTLLGTADIDDAEIEGRFEGTLAVANLLIVRSTGKVSGKFHYGDIEIERGGAISGEVQVHDVEPPSRAAKVATPAPKPATVAPVDEAKTLRSAMFARP